MLRGRDGVSEHGTISRQELDDVRGQTALPQDFVDGVAGGHGGVAGLPQDDVPLEDKPPAAPLSHGQTDHEKCEKTLRGLKVYWTHVT